MICRLPFIPSYRWTLQGRPKNERTESSTFNLQPFFTWLSLDEGDNDPTRFLVYVIAALQSLAPGEVERTGARIGQGLLRALQSPQPPPAETILISLINEIAAISARIVLILDDYHLMQAQPVHDAVTYLLEHLPPQMHLVIATREDPNLPLARLRARAQLTELRATDLRFTSSEAAEFLNQVMGLDLSADDLAALETRTEGWIAGLQLAAVSMQGQKDTTSFIQSFTGSHRFVLEYLLEEVLHQQPDGIQTFLLRTSILDRLCAPLCDEVVGTFEGWNVSTSSPPDREHQRSNVETFKRSNELLRSNDILAYLQRANLFIVPLDNERRWYRYHHLFADLLRQRLIQQAPGNVAKLHLRASRWYEEAGLAVEAFHHAAAAHHVERAARLVEGERMPLHFRGALAPVLDWLGSLPTTVLDARPSLWVIYASASTMAGQPVASVEEKLRVAEAALHAKEPGADQGSEQAGETRDLHGHIAAIRAMLSIPHGQVETMLAQSRRALEFLHPDNLPVRTSASWTLGLACQLQGDRAAASQAYTEAISASQASGNIMVTIAAATCLGQVQESENQLQLAAESYRRVLQLAGDPPLPAACEAHLGLARVLYQWNDLDAAEQHGQLSAQLAPQLKTVDTPASCGVFLARLKLATGDGAGAAALLAEAGRFVRRRDFAHRMPDVAAVQVLVLLRQGDLEAAARLAAQHELPLSQARVHLSQGDSSAALASLEPVRRQADARGWPDERLRVMLLQSLAHHARAVRAHGEVEQALQVLAGALALAQPAGFIRIFVDEGPPMARLLFEAASRQIDPEYTGRLLAEFPDFSAMSTRQSKIQNQKSEIVEPLTERELEVLQLIANGLTNQEIATRLYISLNTVKVHTRNINGKLAVSSRTKAVARARALGLLPPI